MGEKQRRQVLKTFGSFVRERRKELGLSQEELAYMADLGDTTTIYETLAEAAENLGDVRDDERVEAALHDKLIEEVVADKGYHSNDVLRDLVETETRSYVAEPKRGCRKWKGKSKEKAAVYGNRRRIKGRRGKSLQRRRGEFVERPFAHCYDTGGLRRTHLRRHGNILKRLLIHVAGFNLALVMRSLYGYGKPRRLQGLKEGAFGALGAVMDKALDRLRDLFGRPRNRKGETTTVGKRFPAWSSRPSPAGGVSGAFGNMAFSTACYGGTRGSSGPRIHYTAKAASYRSTGLKTL